MQAPTSPDWNITEAAAAYGYQYELAPAVLLEWATDDNGAIIGAIRRHPHADTGEPCGAAIFFDTPATRAWEQRNFHEEALHTVVTWLPLTVKPSFKCRACGSHGFIRDAAWVPA